MNRSVAGERPFKSWRRGRAEAETWEGPPAGPPVWSEQWLPHVLTTGRTETCFTSCPQCPDTLSVTLVCMHLCSSAVRLPSRDSPGFSVRFHSPTVHRSRLARRLGAWPLLTPGCLGSSPPTCLRSLGLVSSCVIKDGYVTCVTSVWGACESVSGT